jgi:pilus assembly protein CpaF
MAAALIDVVAEIHNTLKTSPWFDWNSATSDRDRLLKEVLKKQSDSLDENSRERLNQEFFGLGPLVPLLADSLVTEIFINRPDEIWVERRGALSKYEDHFLSNLTYWNFVHFLCRQIKIPYSVDRPFICGSWNGLRIHIAGEEVTRGHTAITIRKASSVPWTLLQLERTNWCNGHQGDVLRRLVRERQNIIVIGSTGSGKTATLGAMTLEILSSERALILEDTSELAVPNTVSQKLLVREDPQRLIPDVPLSELVKQSLRMRPDRLIVGEVRGPEAKDLLMALSTGHAGSMGTLHASSAPEALLRLEMLIQLGAPQWSLEAVRRLIFLSLNAIVVVGRQVDGRRRLIGIYRIASVESFGFCTERIDAG